MTGEYLDGPFGGPLDEIRAVFYEPVPPLPIPDGQWERITAEASRRRRGRRRSLAAVAAATVALAGAGAGVVLTRPGQHLSVRTDPASSAAGARSRVPTGPVSTRTTTTTPLMTRPTGGPVPARFSPSSVSGSPDGSLYALGYAACPQSPCTSSMVRSTDQGRTWVGLPSPRAPMLSQSAGLTTRDAKATVREVRYATPRDGFAFGGTLWATHDAGARWRQIELPKEQQVLDLSISGDQAWLLVAACPDATSPCGSPRLLRMDAKGDSPIEEPGVRLPESIRSARLKDGADSLTLVVDGVGPNATSVVGTWLLRAGSPWRALPGSPCGTGRPAGTRQLIGPSSVVPTADGSGTLFGFCAYRGSSDQVVTTALSQDDGRTWRQTGGQVRAGIDERPVFAAGSARSVLAAGVASGARISVDGGRTYTAARTPAREAFTWIGSAGSTTVYALVADSQQGMFLSPDGGASFVRRRIG
jgi:hypothetical protein